LATTVTSGDYGSFDAHAAYEDLREAARRATAAHAKRVTVGGIEDPEIRAIRAIYERVYAVDLHDVEAQRQLTAELREEARSRLEFLVRLRRRRRTDSTTAR